MVGKEHELLTDSLIEITGIQEWGRNTAQEMLVEIRQEFQRLQAKNGELKAGDSINYRGMIWTVSRVDGNEVSVTVVVVGQTQISLL